MDENVRINFFKKIYYSIARPSKYEELRKQGVGKAIKYIFLSITLLAIILAIFATGLQMNVVKDAISYLDAKLPEIKFKDNTLTLENGDAVILDDDRIIEYFGNKIVINPLLEKKEAINQYKDLATEKNNVIIFLKNEYVLISSKYNPESENEEGIESKNYADISKNFIKDTSYEYGKKDVIEYLNQRTSYTYYIAQYWVVYFVMLVFLYFIYIGLITIGMWLVTKLSKFKWNFKESLMNTIYASTLSMLVNVLYMIISYFTKFKLYYMDIICVGIIFIYLYLLVWRQKKNNNKQKKT